MSRLPLAALAALLLLAPAAAQAQPSASPFTSAIRYDAVGRVTGTISADPDAVGSGNPFLAVRTGYDPAGRPIKVETGTLAAWQSEAVAPSAWPGFTVLRTVETGYDAMGRKTREFAREGAAGAIRSLTEYRYDAVGRLKCTAVRMDPATFGLPLYDACAPRSPAGSNGADRITRTVYDAAGQRLQLRVGVGTDVEAAEATWAYNANGQVVTVIDGNGNRAELRYDGHGRQDRWTFPSTTRPSAYNDASQATALATAGAVNAADYEQYGYDANGNRTSLRKRDNAVLAYGDITYQYDALNRMVLKVVPDRAGLAAVHERDVYYGYDLRGLQTFARFDSISGEGVTNAYDGFGRPLSSSTDMGGVARMLAYRHDSNGNRTRITHPDGIYFQTDYDGLSRPTWLWANGGSGMAYQGYYGHGAPSGRSLANGANAQWGYDGVQRLSAVIHGLAGTSHDASWTFARNPAGQLSWQFRDNDAYAWTGHYAVARAYTTNGLNQYTAAGGTVFTYDLNGNLVEDGAIDYAYDIENRLVERSGGTVLTYDPLGRLFQVAAYAAAPTQFLYDGDALVAEYVSGAMTRRYVHNVGADVPLLSYAGANLSLPSYLHTDHQGSIVAVSDPWGAGSVNTYDEYGIPGVGNMGRFQYTGQIWLPELGMYYYKARIYSPTLGRFLQTDPIGYDDQFNLYAYVGNDPVNHSDPTGKCAIVEGREVGVCPVWGSNATDTDRSDVQQFVQGRLNDNTSQISSVDAEAIALGRYIGVRFDTRAVPVGRQQEGVPVRGEKFQEGDQRDNRMFVTIDRSDRITVFGIDQRSGRRTSYTETPEDNAEHAIAGHARDAMRGTPENEQNPIGAENRRHRLNNNHFRRQEHEGRSNRGRTTEPRRPQ